MELSEEQTEPASLAAYAADAAWLLSRGRFDDLAISCGYALAYGRPVSKALEEDLFSSLAELKASSLRKPDLPPQATVKYYQPEDHFPVFAVAECELETDGIGCVLLELVVLVNGDRKYLSIEQISASIE